MFGLSITLLRFFVAALLTMELRSVDFGWVAVRALKLQLKSSNLKSISTLTATSLLLDHTPPNFRILMASTDEPELQYLHQYQVLICRSCECAVQNLVKHRRYRHTIAQKRREEIAQSQIHLQLCRPDRVRNPSPDQSPIQSLGKPLMGFFMCRSSLRLSLC